jgi:hypothetical protein
MRRDDDDEDEDDDDGYGMFIVTFASRMNMIASLLMLVVLVLHEAFWEEERAVYFYLVDGTYVNIGHFVPSESYDGFLTVLIQPLHSAW